MSQYNTDWCGTNRLGATCPENFIGINTSVLYNIGNSKSDIPHRTRRTTDLWTLLLFGSTYANYRSGHIAQHALEHVSSCLHFGRWRRSHSLAFAKEIGLIESRTRWNLASFVHQKGDKMVGWTALSRNALQLVLEEHRLSKTALALLAALIVSHPSAEERKCTIAELASLAHMCHQTVRKGLDELSDKGLLEASFSRGVRGTLKLTVMYALISPLVKQTKTSTRSQRRINATAKAKNLLNEIEQRLDVQVPQNLRPKFLTTLLSVVTHEISSRTILSQVSALGHLDNSENIDKVEQLLRRLNALSPSRDAERTQHTLSTPRTDRARFMVPSDGNAVTATEQNTIRAEFHFVSGVLENIAPNTVDVLVNHLRVAQAEVCRYLPKTPLLVGWARSVLKGVPPDRYRSALAQSLAIAETYQVDLSAAPLSL